MNSILIIAHAPLAHALRHAALHVFSDCETVVQALDVHPNASPEETYAAARIIMAQLGICPVLVLTDAFGATPCNVALKLVDGVRSKLVAGVNLPMLLRAISYRNDPLEALVAKAVSGGKDGIMQVAITAPQNQARKKNDPSDDDHQQ